MAASPAPGRLLATGLLVLLSACQSLPTPGATQAEEPAASPATSIDEASLAALQRASDATVGLLVRAVDDARSASTLGSHRLGSGVVIGADGLVLTIGYLILEAQEIWIELDDGRRLPARTVAYDQATGFGLVQSLAPLGIAPVPLGSSAAVSREEPLLFVSGGRVGVSGVLSEAHLAARRAFAGYWEYHIDQALFTAPARQDHSGAGLFNQRGELLGIGSLVVADVAADGAADSGPAGGTHRPGNMFVPVDLLKPVLSEMRTLGSTRASRRAWLGVNCVERDGRLVVVRVNEDGPAERAGLRPGDQILNLDGRPVHDLAEFYRRLWNEGPPARRVTLEIRREAGNTQRLELQSTDRLTTLKRPDAI
jgi:S1-C subfamily serine protease